MEKLNIIYYNPTILQEVASSSVFCKYESKTYLEYLLAEMTSYEQTALTLYDKAVFCKSTTEAKESLKKYITTESNNVDIWAMTTKCVTYPKPLLLYMIGNGNDNANEIISEICDDKINERDASYNKQLIYNTIRQNKKSIKSLCKHGNVNINYAEKRTGLTALQWALINSSSVSFIKFLLNKNASITIQEPLLSRTAIHLAVQTMNYDIISVILENVTSDEINIADKNNVTPLGIYFRFSKHDHSTPSDIETLLVEKGAKYSLLKPFMSELQSEMDNNYDLVKNKIIESILLEMDILKNENVLLNQKIAALEHQCHNLSITVSSLDNNENKLQESLRENSMLHLRITELEKNSNTCNSHKEVHILERTIQSQDKIIQHLSNHIRSKKIIYV